MSVIFIDGGARLERHYHDYATCGLGSAELFSNKCGTDEIQDGRPRDEPTTDQSEGSLPGSIDSFVVNS